GGAPLVEDVVERVGVDVLEARRAVGAFDDDAAVGVAGELQISEDAAGHLADVEVEAPTRALDRDALDDRLRQNVGEIQAWAVDVFERSVANLEGALANADARAGEGSDGDVFDDDRAGEDREGGAVRVVRVGRRIGVADAQVA